MKPNPNNLSGGGYKKAESNYNNNSAMKNMSAHRSNMSNGLSDEDYEEDFQDNAVDDTSEMDRIRNAMAREK